MQRRMTDNAMPKVAKRGLLVKKIPDRLPQPTNELAHVRSLDVHVRVDAKRTTRLPPKSIALTGTRTWTRAGGPVQATKSPLAVFTHFMVNR